MTDSELGGLFLNFTGVVCFDTIRIGRKGLSRTIHRLFWPLATAGVGAVPLALLLFVRTQGMPSGLIYGAGSGLVIGMFVPFLLKGGTNRIRALLTAAALAFAIGMYCATRWHDQHIWVWHWRLFFVAVISYFCIVWFAQAPFYKTVVTTFGENISHEIAYRAGIMSVIFGTVVAAAIYAVGFTSFAGFIF